MKIVVLDGYTLNPGDNPWLAIGALGELEVFDRTTPDQITTRSRDAEILVINKVRLDRETLQRLPKLRLIAVVATGYDVIDVTAAAELGIAVANVPVYGTDSVAQFVFALLLELCHRVGLHDQAVHAGEWTRCDNFSFWKTPLLELAGKTMGIVGFGRIGQRVALIAQALGMRVLAYRKSARSISPALEAIEWAENLEQLFAASDVISLHCPLTSSNRGIVDKTLLAVAKPGALLINTARGPLINEQDLADALNDNRLGGAAVDVVSVEPIIAGNPLLTAQNCIITPHMAWATQQARHRLMALTAENIRAFIKGQPTNLVNHPVPQSR
jgi:glycerate dehydrogenase